MVTLESVVTAIEPLLPYGSLLGGLFALLGGVARVVAVLLQRQMGRCGSCAGSIGDGSVDSKVRAAVTRRASGRLQAKKRQGRVSRAARR